MKKKINLKGVSMQTWVRTIVLALALISQILVLFGKSEKAIDTEKTAEILTTIFTTVAAVWSWWKNNSFTDRAQNADAIMNDNDDIIIEIPCGENETSVTIDENGNEVL